MTDAELELDVTDELVWDPKVDSEEIAVSADSGTVTLRGTVGSFPQKREAGKAAQRVYGEAISNDDGLAVVHTQPARTCRGIRFI